MPIDDRQFEGVLPVTPPNTSPPTRTDRRSNAASGASAAGVRAFTAQAIAFYFRAPVKAFFRTRVDYLASAKAINPRIRSGSGIFSWRTTTPGLLAHAVQTHGWRFIPDQVFPPLLANVTVGAVLYTSYLQILGALHEPSSHAAKRTIPPPPPPATFTAGLAAGGVQSFVAAPLDALQVRFSSREADYANMTMWAYGRDKLREIGVRGIFAGWGLSFAKDSVGSGLFFMTFETVKSQAYLAFVKMYYGNLEPWVLHNLSAAQGAPETVQSNSRTIPVIKPHYALEPFFLMLAGVAASIAQQSVLYPLGKIQTLHYERLEGLDEQAKQAPGRRTMLRAYYHSYQETWKECKVQASSVSGMRTWLLRGFFWNTPRQVPSTSAGLVIFELVRRKYGMGEEVRISEDGYEILLS